MEIYQVRFILISAYRQKEASRTFLSIEAAQRYHRLFLSIVDTTKNIAAAAIFPQKIYDHGTNIYVLTEDNHGEIGYFIDRDKAYEAARDVIMENPYEEHWDELRHDYVQTEILRENITNEDIDEYRYLVGVTQYAMNTPWCH